MVINFNEFFVANPFDDLVKSQISVTP